MNGVEKSVGGARWVLVEPKGTMAQLGDFLSNMGFVSPGQQSLALAGLVLFLAAIVWIMARPIRPTMARGVRVSTPSAYALPKRRGGSTDTMRHLARQGSSAERGETMPLHSRRVSTKSQPWAEASQRDSSWDLHPDPVHAA